MNWSRLGWVTGGCFGALTCYLRNPDVIGILACTFVGGYFFASVLDFIFNDEQDMALLADEEKED